MADTLANILATLGGDPGRTFRNPLEETHRQQSNPWTPAVDSALNSGEIRNLPPRPSDAMAPVSESLSPTMGAYGTANTLANVLADSGSGNYSRAADQLPMLLGMFAGIKAKTANLPALERAQAMVAKGAPRDVIWKDTGWFQGRDGKWRWEIDDSNAHISNAGQAATEWTGSRSHPDAPPGLTASGYEGQFGQGFAHPGIAEAYPSVSNLDLSLRRPIGNEGAHGLHDAGQGMWVVAPDLAERRSIALHELQHEVQAKEGFFGGKTTLQDILASDAEYQKVARSGGKALDDYLATVPAKDSLGLILGDMFFGKARRAAQDALKERWRDAKHKTDVEMTAAHRRAPSEIEARAVEARRDMTPQQRQARPPWLDHDDASSSGPTIRKTPGQWSAELPNNMGGIIADLDNALGVMTMRGANIHPDLRGSGEGLNLYRHLIDEALSNGYRVRSDVGISPSAEAIYQALQKRGYSVQPTPGWDVNNPQSPGKYTVSLSDMLSK